MEDITGKASIIEEVNNSPALLKILSLLEEKGFLIRAADPYSSPYLKNVGRIKAEYEKEPSLINLTAMGVSLYEDFLGECTKSFMMGGHFTASYCSENALEKWKGELKKVFPSDYLKISRVCLALGRYLCARKALTRIYITI